MMDQIEKAQAFKALHVKGAPLVLWNIWDGGSAKAVADAGAKAVATGSWSVAAAQGFGDGEALPMEVALHTAAQIVSAVDLPVSVDFEGGYAVEPAEVAANVTALIKTGVVGMNFEDQVVGGEGLHAIEVQAARIAAIRAAAIQSGVPFFINARTDVFLKSKPEEHAAHLDEALARAAAYAKAGADGFFVPGLTEVTLLQKITSQPLPVNVMRAPGGPEIKAFAQAGVARISHGPFPYRAALKSLTSMAEV